MNFASWIGLRRCWDVSREEVRSLLLLVVLSVLLLAVAIFALENGQPITVRFIYWELQSSVAVVTLAATAAGVLIAGLVGLARRLRRWRRGRAATGAARPASAGLASVGGIDAAHGNRSDGPGATRPVEQAKWTEVR
jgi:uncharacterized integral membrane protein